MKKNLFKLLVLLLIACSRTSCAVQIAYLEEDQITPGPSAAPNAVTIGSLCPACTTVRQFGFSAWAQKLDWTSYWDCFVRLSNVPVSQNYYDARVILACVTNDQSPANLLWSISTTTNEYGQWSYNETLTGFQMFPISQWVFMSFFFDNTINTAYGFHYTLTTTTSTTSFLEINSAGAGSYYNIYAANSTFYWGGKDPIYNYCDCKMQYVRFYLNYVSNSLDKMINLAVMNPASTLYLLHFAADPKTNNNQTLIGESHTNVTQGNVTGLKGFSLLQAADDPNFGPYNILSCLPGKVVYFPLNQSMSQNGLIISLYFKPYSPSPSDSQIIFSIRDTPTNSLVLGSDYTLSSNTISLYTPCTNVSFGGIIVANAWNQIIYEYVQAQPMEFGVGSSSIRMWIDGQNNTRAYCGNFSNADYTIPSTTNAALSICGKFDPYNTTDVINGGYFDIMNFLWFDGSESLFQNTSDPSCEWMGFIQPNETTCLRCHSNYYLQDRECVITPSPGYFLHPESSTLQRCYYGQYYNTSNGICSECNADGQFISGFECMSCDNSCRTCTGNLSNQCSACYSGYALNNSSNTCNAIPITPPIPTPANNTNESYISSFSQSLLAVSSTITQGLSEAASAQILAGQLLGGYFATIFAAGINMLDFIQLLQFCDAGYPPNLLEFYTILSNAPNLIPNPFSYIPHSSQAYTSKRYQFAYFQQSISFLDNSGPVIISLGINLIELVIFKILVKLVCKKRSSVCGKIFRTMLEGVEWSGTIGLVLGGQATIILSFFMQFWESVFYDIYGIISLVISILSLIAFIGAYLISLRFIAWNWKIVREKLFLSKETLKKAELNQTKFEVLWKDYSIETVFGRYFVLFWLLRSFTMVIILYALPQAPLAQAYLFLLLSLFFIAALGIGRPYNKTDLMVRAIVNELILLVQEILVVVFATNSRSSFLSDQMADNLGFGMICLIYTCMGFNSLFVVYSIAKGVYVIWKNHKKRKQAQQKSRRLREIPSSRIDLSDTIRIPRVRRSNFERAVLQGTIPRIFNNSGIEISEVD